MPCKLRAHPPARSAVVPIWLFALPLVLGGCTLGPDIYMVRKVSQVLIDGVAVPDSSATGTAKMPSYAVASLRARFLVSGRIQASTQVSVAGVLPVVERLPMRNGRLQPLVIAVEMTPVASQAGAMVEIEGQLTDRNGNSVAPSKVALAPFPCFPRSRNDEAQSLVLGAAALRVDTRICIQLEFDDERDVLEVLRLRLGTVRAFAADGVDASTATAPRSVELLISPQEVAYIGH